MAFEETDDITTEASVKTSSMVQRIEFIRDGSLPDPGVEIRVVRRVIKDGRLRLITGKVPADKVAAMWTGTNRSIRAHLTAIINNAEY